MCDEATEDEEDGAARSWSKRHDRDGNNPRRNSHCRFKLNVEVNGELVVVPVLCKCFRET